MEATPTATLSRASVVIDKSRVNPGVVQQARKDLKVTPSTGGNTPGFARTAAFKVYHETLTNMYLPRHYVRMVLNMPMRDSWNPAAFARQERMEFFGQLHGTLKQPEAVAACLSAFETVGGGILSLPTGYGKTTVGLYVACQLKVKTLVLTHKEFLMDQWVDRILRFVPNARIGRIRQNTVDVQDKDIVVGMMQSICMKTYPKETFDSFGLLILDEVHHVSAPVFSQCMFRASCPYVLGLSATPTRKDGLTRVLEWFVGPVFYKIERKEQRHVTVNVINYDCPAYALPPPCTRMGSLNLAELLNRLSDDPARNQMLVDNIRKFWAQGRKVIVLSDRRHHCQALCEALAPDAALYIGGMKQEELKKSQEARIIIATYGQANEGLDIPSLDTLVFATPKSDIVQSVGRILREAAGSDNVVHGPVVLDTVDQYGVFYAQFNKRKSYYNQSGFILQYPTKVRQEEDAPPQDFAFTLDD